MPITNELSSEKSSFSIPSPLPLTGGRGKGKEKLDFLPLDNCLVIGFTYTRRTKSINKIDILIEKPSFN